MRHYQKLGLGLAIAAAYSQHGYAQTTAGSCASVADL